MGLCEQILIVKVKLYYKVLFFCLREGVVVDKPHKSNKGSKVNVGLPKEIEVDKIISPGTRCTVKLFSQGNGIKQKLRGIVVPPLSPKMETGIYWGYSVRLAKSFSEVFSKCPYSE